MRRQYFAHQIDRHVALSQVHAIGLAGQGHVNAVVDHQRDLQRQQQGLEYLGTGHKRSRAELFLPQLHAGDTATHGIGDDIGQRAPSAQGGVCDQI